MQKAHNRLCTHNLLSCTNDCESFWAAAVHDTQLLTVMYCVTALCIRALYTKCPLIIIAYPEILKLTIIVNPGHGKVTSNTGPVKPPPRNEKDAEGA